MSTPIDNEKYPPSGDGAKLPGLASPSTDINQLRNVVDNLKEIVEIREGRRGSGYDQVVTWRDLYNVGLVAVQSGGNTFINRTGSGGVSGVTLLSPNLQAMMADEFDRKVKASGAYKDLSSEIGVAAAYKGAPQEVIDILTTNLSDESIKRGADIRTVETKIQQVDKSLALSVRELTAGIDSAQASVREVMYSSANRDEATSGAVTTVNARLNNFGGGGVTVEQKMTATVNRVTGLEGIYSVKIVIDNNGTPYVSGFALSSAVVAGSAATSSFVVNATNFAIYRPGTTSVAPFGVDAGTNTVFINGTLLINSGGTSINSVSATATSANSTANTANGTANTANGTANSAYGLATTANNTANSANSGLTAKLNKAGADVLTGPISLQASNTILVGTTNDGIAIGSTGIIGRKASVTTFSVAADGTAIFSGSVTAGAIIADSVTLNSAGGTSLSIIASQASGALPSASFSSTLQTNLTAGVTKILAGTGFNYRLTVDTTNAFVAFHHKDAAYNATATTGSGIRPAVGISAAGIAMGYNDAGGTWQNAVALSSTGDLTVKGTITAGSIITGSVTIGSGGTSLTTVEGNASSALSTATTANGNATTALTTKLNKSASDILTGDIIFQSAGGFRTGSIAIDGSGNVTGAGVAFTSQGIVGRNAGATTFTLNASTGAAAFKGDITGATGNFAGNVTAGNILSSGATLGTNSGTNFWMRGSDGAAYFGGETTVKGRFTVSGSFNQSGFGDIGAYFTTNAGGATIYAVNTAAGGTINASNSGTGAACLLYNNTSGTFGLPTFWAQNSGSAVAGRFTSAGQAALFTSTGGGYAFIAFSNGATGATAFVQGDFALGYSNSRGDPWIMRAPSTSIAASASYYLNSDGTWKTTASIVPSLSSDSNSLGGITASSWTRIFATNSGNANAGGSGVNILGSTSTGIPNAYVGTSGTSNIVTIDVRTTSPSDIRLKEEIADSDLGLAFVKQLRPVSYKLKADPKHQKGYGFIADEVDQIIETGSSLVYHEADWKVGDETGFKTIHYPSYIAVLTKAIQELSAKVETLEARG